MKDPFSKLFWKRLEAVKTISKPISNVLPVGVWKRFPISNMGTDSISKAGGRHSMPFEAQGRRPDHTRRVGNLFPMPAAQVPRDAR